MAFKRLKKAAFSRLFKNNNSLEIYTQLDWVAVNYTNDPKNHALAQQLPLLCSVIFF